LAGFDEYYKFFAQGLKEWLTSRRFSIYLVCIAISALIWILIKLSQSYNSQFETQIEYVQPPDGNWVVIEKSPKLQVEISGFGFDLFSHYLFGLDDIKVNLSEFNIKSSSDSAFIEIPSAYLNKAISRMMKGNEQVLNIYPEQIFTRLSKAINKKIPVKLNVVVYPATGFKIKGVPQLYPDSIVLFGPAKILKSITEINTEIDTIYDIKLPYESTISLELDSLSDFLTQDISEKLVVDVDELTSGSVEVKVIPEKFNKGKHLKVLPSKITVFYQVGLNDYQKVSDELFKAEIKIPESDEWPDKLKVELTKVPDFVEVKRIEPLFVEYLLIKD